jgi:hypothetical protein
MPNQHSIARLVTAVSAVVVISRRRLHHSARFEASCAYGS